MTWFMIHSTLKFKDCKSIKITKDSRHMNKLEESEIGSRILSICLGHISHMCKSQNQFEMKSIPLIKILK